MCFPETSLLFPQYRYEELYFMHFCYIVFYEYISSYLSISLLKDIYIVPSFLSPKLRSRIE